LAGALINVVRRLRREIFFEKEHAVDFDVAAERRYGPANQPAVTVDCSSVSR
jgi:hypothetical protein